MKKLFIVVMVWQMPLLLEAQEQIQYFGLHVYNPMVMNPAQTGADIKHRAIVHGRFQGTSAYNSGGLLVSYDTYISKIKSGLGIFYYHDGDLNILYNNKLGLNYSFRIKISEEQNLRFGIGLMFNRSEANFGRIQLKDNNDPDILSMAKSAIQVNAGVHYSYSNFSIGLAAFNLFNAIDNYYSNNHFYNRRYFTFYTGYKINLSNKIEYNPQLFVYSRWSEGYTNYQYNLLQIEVYNKLTFAKKVFISPNASLNFLNGTNGIQMVSVGVGLQAGLSFAKYFELVTTIFSYGFSSNSRYSGYYKPFQNFEALLRFKM